MDAEKVLHMTGGFGESSYAKNSLIQKKASDMAKNITLQTIQEVYLTIDPKSFGMADLGCGSGQNTFSIIKEMIEAIKGANSTCQHLAMEFRVYLNDLPNNDFNAIFKALPDFYTELREAENFKSKSAIYIAAYPGTFYGRLFPEKSLHFIHSSNSLHWLSRVPPFLYDKQNKSINKTNIYISESSPLEVSHAYSRQFQEDFSLFLRSRSKEVVSGGRMVLIVSGRLGPNHNDRGITFLWTLLSKSFAILVSQGQVEEKKLDAYNVLFYAPSEDELKDEVLREGSFQMDRFEMFEIDKDVDNDTSYGTVVAKTAKAVQGPMICQHFGDGVLDSLFDHYGRLIDEEMAIQEIKPIYFVFSLRKL